MNIKDYYYYVHESQTLTRGREEIPKARQDTWKFGLKQPTMFELGLWADSI
jgi:hypothetical protein